MTLAVVLAISAATAAAVPTLAATPTTLSAHSARHHHHHHKAKTQTPAATPAAPPTPAPPTVLSCADTDLVPTSQNLDRIVAATLCLVNDQRAVAGLGSLHAVAAMTSAATAHSLDMVAANYVAQADPSGRGPLERLTTTGYVRPNAAVDIAENVASQVGTASTPYQTVSSWMSSPGSRAVILTARYTDTGIGVTAAPAAVAGSGPGATYTEDFGATS